MNGRDDAGDDGGHVPGIHRPDGVNGVSDIHPQSA